MPIVEEISLDLLEDDTVPDIDHIPVGYYEDPTEDYTVFDTEPSEIEISSSVKHSMLLPGTGFIVI